MLRLRLLGAFLLEVDGTPAPRLRSRTGESLLTLLALRAGQPVERLWLAGTLWPESDHEQGLYNLRRNLTDLRVALGSESWRLESPSKLTLSLNLQEAECDVLAFDAALAAQCWSEAVARYGGALLTTGEVPWLEAERAQREQGYLLALERAATQLPPSEALALLERARSLDPLRESVVRGLMQCHQRLGNLAHAVQCYQELRSLLLGARLGSPDAQTQALYAALSEPQRVVWDNLPEPLSAFVGRTAYLDTCAHALTQEKRRLVTLLGMGGIGKTRIACEVAARLRPHFPDGVLWVNLEGATESEALLYRLAAVLGIAAPSAATLQKQLVAALRGKRVLLVLDSAEQCHEAPELAHALLTALSELKILVTARRALDLQAETVVEVSPLSREESTELFVALGKSKHAAFTATAENARDLQALCERLEGIPLAVELAAARVATLTPRELLQRLKERFRLLQSTAHDLLPRQRTLRAALDSSCALLSAQEQSVFAQLSVFAGGFYLDDAETICEAPEVDVLENLHALRRHSLLQAETEPRSQRVRYRFLETVGEYAKERLKEQGALEEQTTRAHAQHFATWAKQVRQQFRTSTEAEALAQLEREQRNLQAVVDNGSLPAELRGECALALAGLLTRRGFARAAQQPLSLVLPKLEGSQRVEALGEWAGLCLDLQEGEQALATATESLALAQTLQDLVGIARAQNLLGQVALYQGEKEVAQRYFTEALAFFEAHASTDAAFVHNNLGLIVGEDLTRDPLQAHGHFARARRLYEQHNNLRGIARVENNAGYVAYLWEDFRLSAQHYQRASSAARRSGDLDLLAKALNNEGEAAEALGSLESACALYEEALALFTELESPYASYTQELLEALKTKK
ncbi:NB-ARC domain-containing protein [Armatimonas sp.]|uniref:ATP-binding protein n=1 Tax=Armatimonas sp. TaxID=1872638 RepID=UPI00286A64C0|nr:NB-ARC domain-containing protein [Armatimonas sp.]